MARTWCKISGIVLILVGIAGFVRPDLLGMHLTPIHNMVHLLSGLIAVAVGFAGSFSAARAFCLTFGAIYLLLGILGMAAPQVVARILQTHAAGLGPDNVVHLVLGAAFLIFGLLQGAALPAQVVSRSSR
jgi:uncharacterized membrane protein HdeD (DUF308 family)